MVANIEILNSNVIRQNFIEYHEEMVELAQRVEGAHIELESGATVWRYPIHLVIDALLGSFLYAR